jgi:N-hydroxyarylamine O-acetyltransferase
MNLDAYLARVHWTGWAEPTLATLQALPAHHAAALPFENLNPILDLPVPIDLPSVERKLVHEGRGGYCFEHNVLLAEALRAIGFEHVEGLAARVMWNRPESVVTPQTHMLLRVTHEGEPWLVDVGFGGLTLTGALRLVPGIEQATPHETFRLVQCGAEMRMEARVRGEWRALYRFDLLARHAVDFELANHWIATHPESHFRANLMAARAEPGRRLALLNADFAIHHLDGRSERRRLQSVAEMREVLARDFLIRLPSHPRMNARFTELLSRPSPGGTPA